MTTDIKSWAVLIDLDGTLYVRGVPVPGASTALERLRQKRCIVRFLTNTDSKDSAEIASDLAAMGLAEQPDLVFSPMDALLRFIDQHPGAGFWCLMRAELVARLPAKATVDENPQYVVIGDCRPELSYEKLDIAFRHIKNGATILALQAGRFFLRKDGPHLDTGALVHALEFASGATAEVLGKPSPSYFSLVLEEMGCSASHAIVVGDDVESDIRGGRAIGAITVLVRTGKYLPAQEEATLRPDFTIESIADLPDLLDSSSFRAHRETHK